MQNAAPLGGALLNLAGERPMIEVQGLTKEYGRLRAVDNLSFRVAPGEVLGFLGPNGAGKTTTMRIVAGFLPPTAGRVLVCGASVTCRRAHRVIPR
jgi:ABC-2 type transport system ATP-binding protein